MTPPVPDISPLAVAVAALSVALGPHMALAVGAYSIILMGWLLGVMIGVYRLPPCTRPQLAAFVLGSLVAVLGVTVPLTEIAAHGLSLAAPWMGGSTDAKTLLFPAAVLVPAVGHSWLDVSRWAWGVLQRRLAGGPSTPNGRDGGPQP